MPHFEWVDLIACPADCEETDKQYMTDCDITRTVSCWQATCCTINVPCSQRCLHWPFVAQASTGLEDRPTVEHAMPNGTSSPHRTGPSLQTIWLMNTAWACEYHLCMPRPKGNQACSCSKGLPGPACHIPPQAYSLSEKTCLLHPIHSWPQHAAQSCATDPAYPIVRLALAQTEWLCATQENQTQVLNIWPCMHLIAPRRGEPTLMHIYPTCLQVLQTGPASTSFDRPQGRHPGRPLCPCSPT